MAVFLPAAGAFDGRVHTIRNRSITTSIEIQVTGGGTIDGKTSQYLTPASFGSYQWVAQAGEWVIVSLLQRPVYVENTITTPLAITTDTALVNVVIPVPGLFRFEGMLPFEWSGGNNQDFTGVVDFKVSGQPEISSIPFGMGRASQTADWPLALAFTVDNQDGALTGGSLAVSATNEGQGSITLQAPAFIDMVGPE